MGTVNCCNNTKKVFREARIAQIRAYPGLFSDVRSRDSGIKNDFENDWTLHAFSVGLCVAAMLMVETHQIIVIDLPGDGDFCLWQQDGGMVP